EWQATKLGRGDKIPTSGAQGPVFAPAKPAFPPSMAVAEPRISCHAVAAQPARQGWHTTCLATKMSLPPKNHYHSRTLQMVFIMSNIPPPNMKNPIHLLAFGLGSGLARKAPGTFGTLAALPFWWFLLQGVPTLQQEPPERQRRQRTEGAGGFTGQTGTQPEGQQVNGVFHIWRGDVGHDEYHL